MTFAIPERKTLTMTSVKPRKEFFGDDTRQAIDLHFKGQFNNEALRMFHAALPAALFTIEGPAASDDVQQELRLPVADLDVQRFTKLRPKTLKWEDKVVGATLSIYYGTGKPLVLQLCTVNDFEFEPINGGAVTIWFHVASNADITEKILGKASLMGGTDVEITLEPPVAAAETPRGSADTTPSAAQQTPESIFTGEAAGDGAQAAPASDAGGWPFPNDPPAVVQ